MASRGVPGLCTRTIRVTRILLRRGHIPGAKALLFRAGSPARWCFEAAAGNKHSRAQRPRILRCCRC